MSSELIAQIKADRMIAVRGGKDLEKSVLGVLLGEIDRFKGSNELKGAEPSDKEALASVVKMCKSSEESITMLSKAGLDISLPKAQLEVLLKYRPSLLGEEDTKALIAEVKTGLVDAEKNDFGKIMAGLRLTGCKVDLKLAAQLIKAG